MLKLKEQLKIVSRLLLQASKKPKRRYGITGFLHTVEADNEILVQREKLKRFVNKLRTRLPL